MSKKFSLVAGLAIVVMLLVGACSPLEAVGLVSKSDLDVANASLTKANARVAELEKQNADLIASGGKLSNDYNNLETDLTIANNKLGEWSGLLCRHTWDEFVNVSGAYPFAGKLPDFPAAEYEVFFTGWSTDPNAELTTTVLVDKEGDVWSMAVDAVDDCLILNPVFFTQPK